VVGRVVKVSGNYSKVLLITDPNSAVGGVVQRTRARGLVVGSGGRELEMKYVEQTLNVEKGDLVVTSALGGIFPKGIVIGRVEEVDKRRSRLFRRVRVEPRVDLARLEEVLVFTGNPKELEGF
jgi:rod shape-determining protein MreC